MRGRENNISPGRGMHTIWLCCMEIFYGGDCNHLLQLILLIFSYNNYKIGGAQPYPTDHAADHATAMPISPPPHC